MICSLFALLLLTSFSAGTAHAQGLGKDRAPSLTVGNRQVTIEASISPAVVLSPGASGSFLVRALDPGSNATIPGINYRISVDLHGTILLDQRFSSASGVISAVLKPDASATAWLINGKQVGAEEQVIAGGQPLEITSKILASGGLYHVRALIEKGSNGLQGLDSDLAFDMYVSVSSDQTFSNVSTSAGTQSMAVTNYFDTVGNFTFSNNTISFQMPFDWQSRYLANVTLVHMEVQFPKNIPELQVNSYLGRINGIDVPERALLIDDYSSSKYRIVHFVVSRPILDMLSGSVPKASTSMIFSLSSAGTPKFPIDVQSLPQGKYVFELSWGPRIIRTGAVTTFAMNLQDVATGSLVTNTGFDFVLRQNGTEVFRQSQYSGLGIYSQQYSFQKPGIYKLSAENINSQGESSQMDLQVLQGNGTAPVTQSKPSGCLIATAAFGSELAPQVQYLRNFRDGFIMKSESGSAFMNTFNDVYYSFSPQVADYERQHPTLQAAVRAAIYPLLGILTLSEWTHHVAGGEYGTMLSGTVASGLIGGTYLWPAGAAVRGRVRIVWFVMASAIAAAIMVLSLLLYPSVLMYTTAAFVVANAATFAVLVPKVVRALWIR